MAKTQNPWRKGMNTQPLVTLVPWTMVAQFLNLMIQLFLIKKFLFKPINEILEKRRQMTDKESRMRVAKEKADDLKNQYESGIAKAREEAARIVQSAQKEAQGRADELVQEARQRPPASRHRRKPISRRSAKKQSMRSRTRSAGWQWILPARC